MTAFKDNTESKQHNFCEVDCINNVFNEYSCHVFFPFMEFPPHIFQKQLWIVGTSWWIPYLVMQLHDTSMSHQSMFWHFPVLSSDSRLNHIGIVNSEIWIIMQTISSNGLCIFFLMQRVSVVLGRFFFNYIWDFAKNQIKYSRQLFTTVTN